MEFLRDVFPELAKIVDMLLESDTHFSLVQSVIIGTGIFGLLLVAHFFARMMVEAQIEKIGYPGVKRKVLDANQKKWSLEERIFLTRLRREAKERRGSIFFYWIIYILNCICMPITIFTWISILVTHGAGWTILIGISLFFGLLFGPVILIHIHDMIFIPEERKRERERYRWNKKKK